MQKEGKMCLDDRGISNDERYKVVVELKMTLKKKEDKSEMKKYQEKVK